jgi:hypothetical protein
MSFFKEEVMDKKNYWYFELTRHWCNSSGSRSD